MAKENKSRYALLGMLSLGPMSGYDIKKLTELSIGHFWNESYAQIYPILKQLEHEGLAVKHAEKQEGRPERYVYTLTAAGHEALKQWLVEPAEQQVLRNELLLKLFFGAQVPLPAILAHVHTYRDIHRQLLQQYIQTELATREEYAAHSNLPYWLITLSYGRHFSQAMLSWCEETLTILEKLMQKEAV